MTLKPTPAMDVLKYKLHEYAQAVARDHGFWPEYENFARCVGAVMAACKTIAERERLETKTWIQQQIADYRSLPRLGATGNAMFLEHRGRVAAYEHMLSYLFERDKEGGKP